MIEASATEEPPEVQSTWTERSYDWTPVQPLPHSLPIVHEVLSRRYSFSSSLTSSVRNWTATAILSPGFTSSHSPSTSSVLPEKSSKILSC